MTADEQLGRTFAALTDPTRRAIVRRLEHGVATISELAEPFAIKLPAVMKHLDVLHEAQLISREKHGRTVTIALAPGPMREAMRWLARHERFWTPRLDRLVAHAEARETQLRRTKR